MSADRVRLDVWLWRARFAKTRAEAAGLVTAGAVRATRAGVMRRLDKPAAPLAVGDVLTIAAHGQVRSVAVAALGARRGPPAEARQLYREPPGALDADANRGHLPGDPPRPTERP